MNHNQIFKIKCDNCKHEFEGSNNECQKGGETHYFCPKCGSRVDENGKRMKSQDPFITPKGG